jgi:hypothetical protein
MDEVGVRWGDTMRVPDLWRDSSDKPKVYPVIEMRCFGTTSWANADILKQLIWEIYVAV